LLFVISKTLGVMALPTNFMIGLGVIGLILLATRFWRLGRALMVVSLMLLAICAWSPLGKLLLYPLETRFPAWDAGKGAPDGIIVLGGSIDADLSVAHGRAVVGTSGDRIIAGAVLAQRYPKARLLYTGGNPNLVFIDAKEADYATELFEGLGIARSRLLMERGSRNTLENAQFSKAMVNPKPGERWLLVTSAYHMPRAIGLFRKEGFEVEAYPVDWRIGKGSDIFTFSNIAGDGLARTDPAAREWMGLIAYRLAGKTDAFLPGPNPK
jgi:uncharacterized SAM-binding protein YcdF (DUF218 family)